MAARSWAFTTNNEEAKATMTDPITRPDHNAPTASTQKKRRPIRRLLQFLIGLLIAAAIIVLMAPTIVSSALGTRLLLSIASQQIQGTLDADDLSIGWFSGQWAQDLRIKGNDGQQVLAVKRIEASDISLLSLAAGSLQWGTVRLVNPKVNITQHADGTDSLSQALIRSSSTVESTSPDPQLDAPAEQADAIVIPNDFLTVIEVVDGQAIYDSPGRPPLEMSSVAATVSLSGTQRFVAKINGRILQSNIEGTIKGELNAREFTEPDGRLALGRAEIDSEATISNVPTVLVDRFLNRDTNYTTLLGPVLNGQVIAKGRMHQLNAKVWANSQNLKALVGIDADATGMQLNSESTIRLRVEPQTWDLFSKSIMESPAKLLNPFNIRLSFSDLSTGLSQGQINAARVKGEMEVKVGDMVLDWEDETIGRLAIRGVHSKFTVDGAKGSASLTGNALLKRQGRTGKIAINIETTNALDKQGQFSEANIRTHVDAYATQLPVNVLEQLIGAENLIVACVGSTLDIHTKAELKSVTQLKSTTGSFAVTAKSRHLNGTLQGTVADGALMFGSQARMSISVQPSFLSTIMTYLDVTSPDLRTLSLAKPATVRLTANGTTLPLDHSWQTGAKVNLQGSVDQIAVVSNRWDNVTLDKLSLSLTNNPNDGSINASLRGDLIHRRQSASLVADLNVNEPYDPKQRTLHARTSLKAVPVQLLRTLIDFDVDWLGQQLDKVAFDAYTTPDGSITIAGSVNSTWMSAYIGGEWQSDEKQIELRQGSWVKYQITPKIFSSWMATVNSSDPNDERFERPLVLDRMWDLKAVIREGTIGVGGDAASDDPPDDEVMGMLDPSRTQLVMNVVGEETAIHWTDHERPMRIKGMKGTIQTSNLQEAIELSIRLDIDREQTDASEGSVASQARIDHLFNARGQLDRENAVIATNTQLENLPTGLLDALSKSELSAALGKSLSGSARSQTSPGTPTSLDVTANSDQAELQLSTNIDDIVSLQSDASFRLHVTPELSHRWLKQIHPLLNDAAASDQPIELIVKQEGFSMPLEDWSIDQITAQAVLDLGTLRFQRSGFVNSIRRAFRRNTNQPPVAKFSPLEAQLKGGILSYRGLTMQMDNLVLHFRGKLDQVHGRLNMVMDIPGSTMAKAFDLRDVIEPGYRFSVPIRGSIDNPEIDVGAIVAESARLAAKSQLRKQGPWGGAASDLLDDILAPKKNGSD